MLNRSVIIAIHLMFFTTLLSISLAFPQTDEFMDNARKNIEKAEREKASRPINENKLGGILSHILRLAEEADTSIESAKKLSDLMNKEKQLHVDAQKRIRVIIDLKSLADTSVVGGLVQSLGGEIEQIGLVPYIGCKIHPKKLRILINSSYVPRIREVFPGRTWG